MVYEVSVCCLTLVIRNKKKCFSAVVQQAGDRQRMREREEKESGGRGRERGEKEPLLSSSLCKRGA